MQSLLVRALLQESIIDAEFGCFHIQNKRGLL